MLRRIIAGVAGALAGLALLVSPASAASLSLTVYRPAITPAGSYVTIKAKATPGAYCAIGISGVLSYGHRKYASSAGNVSWRPRVPMSATGGDHSVKVSCVKGGKRVTRYTTLVVTHTYYWENTSVDDLTEYNTEWSTEVLRIPGRFTVTLEWCIDADEGDGGISAYWRTASDPYRDSFSLQTPGERGCWQSVKTSDLAATGWFRVSTYTNVHGSWRMTVTGIAE
jgi:hypothetical protein